MLLNIFMETLISGLFDELEVQKNGICLKYNFFSIINVLTVTFDQFNASLLNKSKFSFNNKTPKTQ